MYELTTEECTTDMKIIKNLLTVSKPSLEVVSLVTLCLNILMMNSGVSWRKSFNRFKNINLVLRATSL
jgi:hypothetical protein